MRSASDRGGLAQSFAAGAQILYRPANTFYGSRDYDLKDFEGNGWSIGTYLPSRKVALKAE